MRLLPSSFWLCSFLSHYSTSAFLLQFRKTLSISSTPVFSSKVTSVMMLGSFSALAIFVAGSVLGQTFTDCNPLQKCKISCAVGYILSTY